MLGYPALIIDPDAEAVDVELFSSPDLVDHWPRLDAFEGIDYRRVPVAVTTQQGTAEAWIYVDA